MSAVLQAESLGKRYASNWALRDCSFALEQGRIAALVGPNGAGGSTLLELARSVPVVQRRGDATLGPRA